MADFNRLKRYPLLVGAQITDGTDVDALVAAGVTAVLDCQIERDDTPLLFGHAGMAFLWDGRADDGRVGLEMDPWWDAGLRFAASILGTVGAPTVSLAPELYVHCAAGVNRGPSMAYGILRSFYALSAVDAEVAIREVRPQVGLAYKADFERYWAQHHA